MGRYRRLRRLGPEPPDDHVDDHRPEGIAIGLLDWMLERIFGDFLDRSRLTAHVRLTGGSVEILCANTGRTPTSVNAVGYRTTDGETRELPVQEELPAAVPAHGELLLHHRHWLNLAFAAEKLRHEGRAIAGFWIRQIGMKTVDATIDADALAEINGMEPRPLITFI